MAVAEAIDRARPRAPGIVYGGLATALLILVAAIALTTRQPPPPSIAEFAPQAVEQIKDAPTEQSSEFGSGDGGSGLEAGALGADPTSAKAAARPIDVPRVRRCVGSPPRQIEDPQSPPCVPYWEGDNGGATARGVTRDEIRIYVPSHRNKQAFFKALEKFFNRRFEFYGRRLNLIIGKTANGTNYPADQKAEAVAADEQQIFASLMFRTAQGFYYHEELARRHIPSAVAGIFGAYDRDYLSSHRPYLWSYLMEADPMFAELGRWACGRLAGRPAAHAGDPLLQSKTRVFGVIMQTSYGGDTTSYAPLERELRLCGAASALSARNPMEVTGGEDNQPTGADPVGASNVILQMQRAGVTSVFCLCQPYAAGNFMKAASNQGYAPEWLLSSYGNLDTITGLTALGAAPPDQLAHAFGLTFVPKQVAPDAEPVNWAIKEGDPAVDTERSSSNVVSAVTDYRPLLILASGIQMAGPNLTPETFERALQRTRFPNPVHPNLPGAVGFEPARYAMTTDAAEWWWSNTAQSPYFPPNQGTPCYVDHGARRGRGAWPQGGDPFFAGPCDAGG